MGAFILTLNSILKHCLTFLLLLMVSSCNLANSLGEEHVSVTDKTEHWGSSSSSRKLLAEIIVDDGWIVESVQAYSTRHYWPGREKAHVIEAGLITNGPNTGLWQAIPQGASLMPPADTLMYQWRVLYRLASGQDILETTSQSPASLVINCTQQQIDNTYNTVRVVMNGLQSSNGSLNLGYLGPAHVGPFSLLDQGVPYARQTTIGGQIIPVFAKNTMVLPLGDPDLLLYAPRPREDGESASDYFTAITDILADPPYTLLGVAYGATHLSATRRPRLGCIPSDQWFVHEAGYHQLDGGYQATPPNETILGETAVSSGGPIMGMAPTWAPAPDEGSPVWHPRLWDLHFWIVNSGSGKPVMRFGVPQGQVGIELEDGFFYPETFE